MEHRPSSPIARILLLLCSYMTFQMATLASAQPKLPVKIPLPRALSDVSLGMPLKDFVRLHPKVRPFNFGGPKKINMEDPTQTLNENIKDALFDAAMYDFEKGKLKSVALAGLLQPAQAQSKRGLFLKQMVNLYGAPSSFKVIARGTPQPGIVWSRHNFVIVAFTNPPDKRQGIEVGQVELFINSRVLRSCLNFR